MHTGALNGGVKESKFVVEVPPETRLLRLAFNGQDDGRGGLDFDVHVRKGVQSAVAAPECALEGAVQFGFCEIKNPVAGKWSVTVTRKRGDGAYQLTSTTYAN